MRPGIVREPMSRNEIILGVVALVLIGFSLIVSLVVPRRRPDFPAGRIGLFAAVAALLVVAMLATVEVWGEEEEESEAEPAAETQGPPETGATGGETAPAETAPAETGGADTGGGGGGDVAQGKELFASSGCGSCHTLADAGTTGTTGPNLDDLKPGMDAAVEQITNGGGGMPPFGSQLSEAEINAIAAYIVSATQ
jgi:mono/diheme cytochrome c family protein